MKFVILGRTGTGKTRLAEAMAQIGNLKLLKTSTTRQPRDDADKERYNFVTEAEADRIAAKYLYTEIGTAKYFCREEDLKACDIAVLEPDGLQDITALLPEEVIYVIYAHVDPGSETAVAKFETALDERINASKDPNAVRKAIADKRAAESERFDRVEELLFDMVHPDNNPKLPETRKIFVDPRFHNRVQYIADFMNDFDEEHLSQFALNQVLVARRFKNIRTIVQQCADLEILTQPVPGMVQMRTDRTNEDTLSPIDDCTHTIMNRPAAMTQIFNAWLTHELNIGVPNELLPKPVAAI